MGKIITNRHMPKKANPVPIGNIGREPLVIPNYSGVKRSLNEGPQEFLVKRDMTIYDDIKIYFGTNQNGYIYVNNSSEGMYIYNNEALNLTSAEYIKLTSSTEYITINTPTLNIESEETRLEGGLIFEDYYTILAGDSSPGIKYYNIIRGTATGRGFNIVTFDGGAQGQIIRIRMQSCPITFTDQSQFGGNNLYLAGGVNFSANNNDTLTLLYDDGNWYELSRSVN